MDVTSSMKNHMEYEEWLKNYAPSILGMVLQQLSVFKDVFVMQSDDILGCLLLYQGVDQVILLFERDH